MQEYDRKRGRGRKVNKVMKGFEGQDEAFVLEVGRSALGASGVV